MYVRIRKNFGKIFRAIGLCPNGNHASMQADSNLLIDRGKCAKCAKKAMSTGGCKASKEAKRLAGRKGGKWSGMMRRSVQKLSKDGVSILTRTGHTSRQKLYSSDITFGEFVTESKLMDQRKAVVLTQNLILQYAYIERIDKTRDFVFRETRTALLETMRHRRLGWRKACVRIVPKSRTFPKLKI